MTMPTMTPMNGLDLRLPVDCVIDCSLPGVDATEAVDFWLRYPPIRDQLEFLGDETIRDHLRQYGAWSEEELLDDDQNQKRFLWVICGDAKDMAERFAPDRVIN